MMKRQKKVLYYSIYRDYIRDKAWGISGKIEEQIAQLEKAGMDVISKGPKGGNICFMGQNLSVKKWNYLTKLEDYDAIYIRYDSSNFDFWKLLRKYRKCKPKGKILLEIPSYPFRKIQIEAFGMVYYIQNCFWLFLSSFYVDRIIMIGNSIEKLWRVPVIRINNGIDFEKVKIRHKIQRDSNIHIIAVANFGVWHGYDRLIKGLYCYYKKANDINVVLHLVGGGEEEKQYRALVKKYRLEEFVLFHGILKGDALDEIYDQCDIGAESFGAHRINIKVSSSLKSREYGAKGLPIITAANLDVYNKETYKYICKFPENEEAVDISKIVSFYHQVYDGKDYEKTVKEIRKTFYRYYSFEKNFKSVINYLQSE